MSDQNIEELPLLTFNSLYNVLREEKKNKGLQKLPDKFYESVDVFFESKKKEVDKLKSSGTDKEKLRKERHVVVNSKKIVLEMLNLRSVKLSNIAIKNNIFDEDLLSNENVLEDEKEFLESVEKSVKKLKKRLVKNGA